MTTLISETRKQAGVSLRELANRCGVKPATIQSWERSERAGSIQFSTLRRALGAMNRQLSVDVETRLERFDQRVSLEYHRAVLTKLRLDPEGVLSSAAKRLPRVKGALRGELAERWMQEWSTMIDDRDFFRLEAVMTGLDQRSIDLRQVSPFDAVLTQQERRLVVERAK